MCGRGHIYRRSVSVCDMRKSVGFTSLSLSQLQWRPYGHLICTPVCLLAGSAFLNGLGALSNATVREMMQAAHNLYVERFAIQKQPLTIQELYELIPHDQFELTEAAGMLLTKEAPGSQAEDLLVMPLAELLRFIIMNASRKTPACLIVTTMNHTTCFLADRLRGRLELFDPLPASVSTLPDCEDKRALEEALALHYGQQNASAPFSAVLLQRKGVYDDR